MGKEALSPHRYFLFRDHSITHENRSPPLFLALLAGAALALTGCYHAKIMTGKPASSQVIENKWASGFIAGLVPPSEINTAQQCSNGVSQVETKHSFLNLIAQAITFNLYSPMSIKVTCAAAGTAALDTPPDQLLGAGTLEMVVPEEATPAETAATFDRAADQSFVTGQPVQVRFEQPAAARK